MSCDHNTITNLDLPSNKHYLVYCDGELIATGDTKNEISTPHEVETFVAAQAHANRGLALGLSFSIDHKITALENGATLPQNIIDGILDVVWDMDMDYGLRMEALGYTRP